MDDFDFYTRFGQVLTLLFWGTIAVSTYLFWEKTHDWKKSIIFLMSIIIAEYLIAITLGYPLRWVVGYMIILPIVYGVWIYSIYFLYQRGGISWEWFTRKTDASPEARENRITFGKIFLSILLFAFLYSLYIGITLFLIDIFSHNIYISEELIFGVSGLLGFILYIYLCHRWFVRFPKTLLLIFVDLLLVVGIFAVVCGGMLLFMDF